MPWVFVGALVTLLIAVAVGLPFQQHSFRNEVRKQTAVGTRALLDAIPDTLKEDIPADIARMARGREDLEWNDTKRVFTFVDSLGVVNIDSVFASLKLDIVRKEKFSYVFGAGPYALMYGIGMLIGMVTAFSLAPFFGRRLVRSNDSTEGDSR